MTCRFSFVAAAFLVLIVGGHGSSSAQTPIPAFLAKARELESGGSPRGAIDCYQEVLKLDPSNRDALKAIAHIHYRLDEYRASAEHFRRAIDADPLDASFHNDLGLAYRELGQRDLAETHLRTAIAMDPAKSRYANNLATVLTDKGEIEQAYSALSRVHPPAAVYFNMAWLFQKQGKLDRCREHLDIALAFDPGLGRAKTLRAEIDEQTDPKDSNSGCLVDQNLDPSSPQIFINVTLKGKTLNFILDTGSSCHVFGTHLIPLLDGTVRRSDRRPESAGVCDPQNICVQGVSDAFVSPAVVMDLTRISAASQKRIDGVLGIPFLRDRVLLLDFDRQRLRILSDCDDAKGKEFDIMLDQTYRPFVKNITVANDPLDFLIDTGMNGELSLSEELFDVLTCTGYITRAGIRGDEKTRVFGNQRRNHGHSQSVAIGGLRLSRVSVHDSDSNKIGMKLLRRFNVKLDFIRKQLILDPREAAISTAAEIGDTAVKLN